MLSTISTIQNFLVGEGTKCSGADSSGGGGGTIGGGGGQKHQGTIVWGGGGCQMVRNGIVLQFEKL